VVAKPRSSCGSPALAGLNNMGRQSSALQLAQSFGLTSFRFYAFQSALWGDTEADAMQVDGLIDTAA